jgi:hypothetical protein
MNIRKSTTAISAAVFLALGLSACNSPEPAPQSPVETQEATTEPAPSPTKATTPRAAPSPSQEPTAQDSATFLADVRERFPDETHGSTDAELLEIGDYMCQALDTEISIEDLALEMIESDVDPDFFDGMLSESIESFCPEYQPDLDDFHARYAS